MLKASDFRQKEVVNICDGRRLGFVCDVDINLEKGTLNAIVVPGCGKILGLFGGDDDYVIPWHCIKTIGDDIILVDFILPERQKKGDIKKP